MDNEDSGANSPPPPPPLPPRRGQAPMPPMELAPAPVVEVAPTNGATYDAYRHDDYTDVPLVRYLPIALASRPALDMSPTDCVCRRDTLMFGMGTRLNPLVFENISINDVRIVYDPRIEVVYSNVTFTNVQEDISGSNVSMHACRRNYSGGTPFGDTNKCVTIDMFGSEKFPLVFCEQTFVRAAVDCNDLSVWFVHCTFIDCVFANAGSVKIIDCKHHTTPFPHQDTVDYKFFVRIDETRCIWGHVVPSAREDPPTPQPQLSPTQEVIQRWRSNLREGMEKGRKSLEKSKSGRRLLQMMERRPSSTALVPSVQGPSPSTNLQPQVPQVQALPQTLPQAQTQPLQQAQPSYAWPHRLQENPTPWHPTETPTQ